MTGNVDNPESTVRPVTPIEMGEEDLENPESLPQENFPCGLVRLPEVDSPTTEVVDIILQVATPVVDEEWKELII